MNKQQLRVAKDLQDSLDACFPAGLMGGVFESSFYVWPQDADPSPQDEWPTGERFEERVELAGGMELPNRMWLDGGAGN